MLTHLKRSAAIGMIAVLSLLTLLQPANADTRTFSDKADTGRKADITTVKVAHGTNVLVSVKPGRVGLGDYFRFYIDTVASNAGPEYKVEIYPNSDGFSLQRVGSFTSKGTYVKCDGLRAKADAYDPDWISITVPRSCMKNPDKVRLAVRGHYAHAGPDTIDWAPGKHKFFGWVKR